MERIIVAVVGGGIGGVYAAWRLQTDPRYGATPIYLFEASERVGGQARVADSSWRPAAAGRVRRDGVHDYAHAGERPGDQGVPAGSKPVPEQTPNLLYLLYLRGNHLTETNIQNGTVPYVLAQSEQGKAVGDLLVAVVTNLIGTDPTTLDARTGCRCSRRRPSTGCLHSSSRPRAPARPSRAG